MTEGYMCRAIELARAVEGYTSPNPPVGAVLVRGDQVVGEGSTQPAGGPHAEIMALRAAGDQARGSTLYVTLEPCSHWGRTPPCANALIRDGVAAVHAAVLDPNPAVRGAGVERLETHGIEVVVGECAVEAADLIAAHTRYSVSGLPLVTLFYSGPATALERMVSTTDIVLTVTDAGPPDPALPRVIRAVDRSPLSRVVTVGPIAVVVTDVRREHVSSRSGLRSLPSVVWNWQTMLIELGRREITSAVVLAHGGPGLSLLEQHLVDRIVTSSRAEIPGGFSVTSSTREPQTYFVAGRDDRGE